MTEESQLQQDIADRRERFRKMMAMLDFLEGTEPEELKVPEKNQQQQNKK
jgi:hypothetical protein